MPVPATTGQLRTKISEMQVGDYVACLYAFHSSGVLPSGSSGVLWGIGYDTSTVVAGEKPIGGEATHGSSKYFYLVKADKGLLISDRVCQHTLTWDTLNSARVVEGFPYSFTTNQTSSQGFSSSENISGILRSLTGGVAYADADGNSSTTNRELGAFPLNNEWDKYIVNFPIDKIQSGKTLDDVFHWNGVSTWTQDSPSINISPNTHRVTRGKYIYNGTTIGANEKSMQYNASNGVYTVLGFRPVFEYKEV